MTCNDRYRAIASLAAIVLIVTAAPAAGFFAAFSEHPSQASEPEILGRMAIPDVRPDPSVNSSDLYMLQQGTNVSSATFGYLINVHVIVYNLGGSNVTDLSVRLGVRGVSYMVLAYNYTIFGGLYNISSSATDNFVDVNYSWRVPLTESFQYEMWALLDSEGGLDEQNETNNFATYLFWIDPLSIELVISAAKEQYDAGENIIYTAEVTYYGTTTPVQNLSGLEFYVIELATNEEVPNTRTQPQTTSDEGTVVGIISLPIDLPSGRYQLLLEFSDSMYSGNSPEAFEVNGPSEPLDQLLMPIVAIALIVGVVAVVAYFVMRRPRV